MIEGNMMHNITFLLRFVYLFMEEYLMHGPFLELNGSHPLRLYNW